jgi:hypothetical protein
VPINRWTGKENVAYIHHGLASSHKEEWKYVIYKKMDGAGDYHVKWNKPDSEWQIACFLSYAESRPKKMIWV